MRKAMEGKGGVWEEVEEGREWGNRCGKNEGKQEEVEERKRKEGIW